MSDNSQPQVSTLERYLALKGLRENVFLQRPAETAFTEFAEDIPGVRHLSAPFMDTIPALTMISGDPKERHEQLEQAKRHFREEQRSASPISDSVFGALRTGLLSIPASAILSVLSHKLLHGKAPGMLRGVVRDSAIGAGYGAAFGGGVPLLAHSVPVSDQALDQAEEILQKHPKWTALPVADIAASAEDPNHPRNNALLHRALVGAAAGGATGLGVSGLQGFRPGLKPALLGTGLGALAGTLTTAIFGK